MNRIGNQTLEFTGNEFKTKLKMLESIFGKDLQITARRFSCMNGDVIIASCPVKGIGRKNFGFEADGKLFVDGIISTAIFTVFQI